MSKTRSFTLSPLSRDALAALESLGQQIALARKARGYSQKALATTLGINPQTMLFIEQGRPNVQIGHYTRALSLLNAPMVGADHLVQSDKLKEKSPAHKSVSQERIHRARAVRRHLTHTQQRCAPDNAKLEFTYDWSNQQMSDETLIHKVVDKGRFHDLAIICKRFGLDRVRRIAQTKLTTSPSLRRAFANIEQGFIHTRSDSA